MKKDWLPYAAVVALILGSWKVYNNRPSHSFWIFPSGKVGANRSHLRSQEMSQPRGVSGIQSEREDDNLAQCRHVGHRALWTADGD